MQTADDAHIKQAILYLSKKFRNPPDLETAARAAGMNQPHFRRLFTQWAGVDPELFLRFLAADHARDILLDADPRPNAVSRAKLPGLGRFRNLAVDVYAVAPGRFEEQGAGMTIRYGVHEGMFGSFFLAVSEKGVCALTFLEKNAIRKEVETLRGTWRQATILSDSAATKGMADRIFSPREADAGASVTAVVKGTDFQIKVWKALVQIPPGRAESYEGLASRIGAPRASRAVGSACARNPVTYLIPCHRVIRKTGAFGRYGGGDARKRVLLAMEAAWREAAQGNAGRSS